MGLLDKLKKTAKDNADKITEGVDKVTDTIDEKTGGKHRDKLDKVDEMVDKGMDKIKGDEPGATSGS